MSERYLPRLSYSANTSGLLISLDGFFPTAKTMNLESCFS